MRDILFRGKRIDSGEWVYGFYNHFPCGRFDKDEQVIQTVKENGKIGQLYDVIPETVGQYTGLTDKNGKKIFEGDRLHENISDGIVVFKDGEFIIEWGINGDWWNDIISAHANNSKITGNIYDKEETK